MAILPLHPIPKLLIRFLAVPEMKNEEFSTNRVFKCSSFFVSLHDFLINIEKISNVC